MNVRMTLQAVTLVLCSLAGYAVCQTAHRIDRIAGPMPLAAAAKDGTGSLQDWAAAKTVLGLGFPLDESPERMARFSHFYTPIEWDAWQATRANFAGAHEAWVTVVEPPRVSVSLNDTEGCNVDLSVRISSKFKDAIRVEQATVHMAVVPGSDDDHEPYRLTRMTVEP